MKKYLITSCDGFIGPNFVYYMLKKHKDILLINLDKFTYAGNLENLKGVEGDSRHIFVQGNICDNVNVTKNIAEVCKKLNCKMIYISTGWEQNLGSLIARTINHSTITVRQNLKVSLQSVKLLKILHCSHRMGVRSQRKELYQDDD